MTAAASRPAMTRAASLPPARPAVILGGLGAAAMAVSWIGASRSLLVAHQTGWAIVGVAGTAAVILAGLVWILSARRMVECRLGQVLARLDVSPADAPAGAAGSGAGVVLVAGPAMAHYHRPACRLAAGKAVSSANRREHEAAGRRPCGVCRP